MVLVRDVMTPDPVSVPPHALIDAAIEVMLSHNVSGLPVVDDGGRPVGILSEYDVLQLFEKTDVESARLEPCRTYMTASPRTIDADASLDVAARIFRAVTIRRLLVVSRGELVGVLSRRDVVRAIRDRRMALDARA